MEMGGTSELFFEEQQPEESQRTVIRDSSIQNNRNEAIKSQIS